MKRGKGGTLPADPSREKKPTAYTCGVCDLSWSTRKDLDDHVTLWHDRPVDGRA